MQSKLTLDEVNSMRYSEFIGHFNCILDHGTVAASTVWVSKPFHNFQALYNAFEKFIQGLGPELKEGFIRCYPDTLRQLSEQTGADSPALGLTELEKAEIRELSDLYSQKFGFPLVKCVRECDKEILFHNVKARLENTLLDEIEESLSEIGKIAYHRLISKIYY